MSEDEEGDCEFEEEEDEDNDLVGYQDFTGKRIKIEPQIFEPEEAPPIGAVVNKPLFDIDVNRPSLVVTDSVSYYNLGSLVVLLYGHVTEGIKTPSIFDKDNQRMVIKETEFNF